MRPTAKAQLRLTRAYCVALALAGAGVSLSGTASAQQQESASRSAARALGTSGVDAYLDGRYEQAVDELEKAYAILHVPSLALWSGRALDKRGRLVEAAERYSEAASLQVPAGDAQVQKQAAAEAAAELGKLRPRIPTITVALLGAEPAEVELSIDGKVVPASLVGSARLVDPGRHDIVATRGAERVTTAETVGEGQRRRVELRFRAAAQASPGPTAPDKARVPSDTEAPLLASASTSDVTPTTRGRAQKTWAVVALAAGGAGLVVGGVTGVLAMGKHSELEESGKCNDGCAPAVGDDVDRLNLYRTLSTVGFIAGGVLAAGGIVLWVSAPAASGAHAQAQLLPNGFVLKGNF